MPKRRYALTIQCADNLENSFWSLQFTGSELEYFCSKLTNSESSMGSGRNPREWSRIAICPWKDWFSIFDAISVAVRVSLEKVSSLTQWGLIWMDDEMRCTCDCHSSNQS
jgi:hypothetical protein